MKNIIRVQLLAIITSVVFSSCATLINGPRQTVEIFSIPDSCDVYLNGVNTNKLTPCKVKVKRRVKPTFYNAKNEQSYILKKKGFYDFEVKDKAKFSPVIISDVVLSGVGLGLNTVLPTPGSGTDDDRAIQLAIGLPVAGAVIDGATGSYYRYQKRIFAELQAMPGSKTIEGIDEIPISNITSGSAGLALCIGNSNYKMAGQLPNPVNDANDMTVILKRMGFEVIKLENASQVEMRKTIDDFGRRLKDFEVGLFFFAGHGIQAKGINYLIPVDAQIESENDVEYTCVNAGRILGKMEDAGSTTNIIILDACRNNPFERSWTRGGQGRGLAVMDAPIGSLIAFATSPGSVASDGSGRNGLYTSAILRNINEPGITIIELFQKVRKMVREESTGDQVPWESTSLEGNFYFRK